MQLLRQFVRALRMFGAKPRPLAVLKLNSGVVIKESGGHRWLEGEGSCDETPLRGLPLEVEYRAEIHLLPKGEG